MAPLSFVAGISPGNAERMRAADFLREQLYAHDDAEKSSDEAVSAKTAIRRDDYRDAIYCDKQLRTDLASD
ncbi:MAG TPA: hypothetical protein VHV55_21825 [Pirellulales bacterium]|nr:hypothetical protein [Pirellulales bacterium]